ncbi:GTPase [Candidatus Woesearchaeota archaeon]|jgi:predicted GTPase|nr:GTPase [Candidatus Woesearchaeota archaeon]
MDKKNVIIMGAAGRDFHNFNTYYRDNENYNVVCFTATQIPGIEDKKYPAELAGQLYPEGIPIIAEEKLAEFAKKENVLEITFSYSDVPHEYVMHKASQANALGADFKLIGTHTMLKSIKPVIAVCATRTGCGKSQTTRKICDILISKGKKVVAVRHPMPYGDLVKQAVQRFENYEDFEKHECTIEEREEYEPLVEQGIIVYAGVDYEKILRQAEQEADVVLWDGGNNDTPFFKPDLFITVADPHRPGHELSYYPGETNLRMADIVLINKEDTAEDGQIKIVEDNVKLVNPTAKIMHADSTVRAEEPELIEGKKVLIIEDGPTLTHGGMKIGAGFVAAQKYNCEIINPIEFVSGELKHTMEKFGLSQIIPAMGYSDKQIKELTDAIDRANCEGVVIGTPFDLKKLMSVSKPATRIRYDLFEKGEFNLIKVLDEFLK